MNIMLTKVILCLSFLILVLSLSSTQLHYYSVYLIGDRYVVHETYDETAVATSKYVVAYNEDGWGKLYIKSNSKYDDLTQAFAVGYLEGQITSDKIYQHYTNYRLNDFKDGFPDNVKEFFTDNLNFMDKLVKDNPKDIHSQTAIKIYTQFKGMVKGYNDIVEVDKKISSIDFNMISSTGDMFEIVYYKKKTKGIFDNMSAEEIIKYKHKNSHCTALIRINDDFSDMFIGHNTWDDYSTAIRILKTYEFNYNDDAKYSRRVSFTSFPGKLSSTDDYYVTSNNLVVQETTNTPLKDEIFSQINPNAYLNWVRTMIANRLSTNAEEWINNFTDKNSGTYNNQYMIVDLKLIDLKNKKLADKAFMINEQTPLNTYTKDVTDFLRNQKYWPSFNTPFFPEVRKAFGYEELVERVNKNGSDEEKFMINSTLGYESNDRFKLLKKIAPKVNNLNEFKQVFRYNNYKVDEESLKRPGFSLSSRFDLDTGVQRMCMGAYDAKVLAISEIKDNGLGKFHAILGPTEGEKESDIGPLIWSENDTCKNVSHIGIRDNFLFYWIEYEFPKF